MYITLYRLTKKHTHKLHYQMFLHLVVSFDSYFFHNNIFFKRNFFSVSVTENCINRKRKKIKWDLLSSSCNNDKWMEKGMQIDR